MPWYYFTWLYLSGSSFVTVGDDSDKKVEPQTKMNGSELLDYKADFEDAEVLGKFWNSNGYYLIVYDNATKAPEMFKVEFSERIGDTY